MPRMGVQRAGDDHGIDILYLQQAARIVERLNGGHSVFRLIAAAAVDIRHRNDLDAVHGKNLTQQIISTITHANHADANAVVGPQARARLDMPVLPRLPAKRVSEKVRLVWSVI